MKKKIKTLELFAGYGSQVLAPKRLGYEIDPNSEIVEWGVNPAIAYNVLHEPYNQKQNFDNWQELIGSVSNDTKELAKSIKKHKREALVDAVNKTNNFRNVLDYNIKELFDLLTYSFPCQDLSNQGKQKGMGKNSGTRSGLLWEVERMLVNTEHKPKVLLMENVKALIGKKNIEDFNEWIKTLEDLGYHNTYKVLNSAHFGVGQNRERVFMLSFLDKEAFDNFKWPEPSEEKTPFSKHMMSLEEIEESLWPLNEKDFELNEYELLQGKSGNYKLGNHIPSLEKIQVEIFKPYYTSGEKTLKKAGVDINKKIYRKMVQCFQVNHENNQQPTLPAGRPMGQEESNKTYQTLTPKEKYNQVRANAIGDYKKEFNLDLYAKNWSQLSVENENNPGRTIETSSKNKVFQIIEERGGIVRFVRPLEKARLMGLTDEEFWKLYDSVLSTNEIEAMLGNSIVVDVLEAILKNVTF